MTYYVAGSNEPVKTIDFAYDHNHPSPWDIWLCRHESFTEAIRDKEYSLHKKYGVYFSTVENWLKKRETNEQTKIR